MAEMSERGKNPEFYVCHVCGFQYDMELEECPKCGEPNEKRK
jgi:rubrerythrin